ncbi:pyocin knob domain-containing protein [Enterococcus casseliflavus]|uniref:pyocin knob domain-containing protein n=1 Tax=Enterococcus casseliflavus TaxID=37734 RepID=UPI00115AA0C4|nr:pyocin knob domain-containing protein [Enterococcus casseliflavus]
MAKQWKNEDIIYPEDAQRWESGLENAQQNNAQNETNLKKHSDDKLNPHNVTAAQTGAYAKAEVDTKDVSVLSTAKAYTDLHSVKKDNPHGVTAAQVGAYSKVESDSNLTAALLPKTDSRGYSNGIVTDISGADLNNLTETGTFMGSALTNAPSSSWWFITNLVHASNYITQIAYVVSATADRPRVRKKSNGIWGEWQTLMFTSDNAVSSSKLQTPRRIAGVDFDGTKDISIPANNVGAYTKNEVDTQIATAKSSVISGNVSSATKLQNPRKINGVDFDGTSDISITADPNQQTIPANTNLDNLTTPGFWSSVSDGNTGTLTNVPFGTGTFTLQVETGLNDTRIIQTAKRATNGDIAIRSKTESAAWRPWVALAKNDGNIQAGLVAEKASRLANPRTIAGVQFDGTSNIAIAAGNVGAYTKAEVDSKLEEVADPSWIDVSQYLTSSFKVYNSSANSKVVIQRINKTSLLIAGVVSPTKTLTFTSNAQEYDLISVPKSILGITNNWSFAPAVEQASGTQIWLLGMSGDTNNLIFKMSRHRYGTTWTDCNAGDWLPFNGIVRLVL